MPSLPLGVPSDIDQYFYNRKKELISLNSFINTLNQDVANQILITGHRGVGKSFLLKKLIQDLPDNILTAYIDISNVYGVQKGNLSEEQIYMAGKAGVKNLIIADIFEYLKNNHHNFDLIVVNDFIEHLRKDEVIGFLTLLYNSISQGGQVLISTVNARSIFGAGLVFSDFTHEQGFTIQSLSQVLRLCNFSDVKIYGEKPIAYDYKSAVRASMWWCLKKMLKVCLTIERGTGRDILKLDDTFEPRIFAIGKK